MKANRSTILIGVNDVSQSSGKSINLKKSEIDYRLMLNRSGVAKPDSKVVFMDPFVLRMIRLSSESKGTMGLLKSKKQVRS